MKLRLLGILFFAFLSACGGGGSSSGGGGGDQEDLILALGDSIGAGAETGGYAFPDIASILTAIPVVNTSEPGATAETEVLRAQSLIDQHHPRYLIAMLGTNNALGAPGGADGAIHALQTLANICESNGIFCIISTLPPITSSSDFNGNVKKINAGIFGISNAIIANSNAVLSGSDLLSDGIHPNTGGQDKIGQVFADQLIPLK